MYPAYYSVELKQHQGTFAVLTQMVPLLALIFHNTVHSLFLFGVLLGLTIVFSSGITFLCHLCHDVHCNSVNQLYHR